MVEYVNFTLPKRPWLRGGIIGAVICVVLFVFYLFVYFPIIDKAYADQLEKTGASPAWTTTIPLSTGHLWLYFLHDGAYGLASSICPTEPQCYSWSVPDLAPNCLVPWKEEGIQGCCTGLDYVPKRPCTTYVENATMIMFILLLIGIYFLLGAGIGWVWGKKRS